jgi:hypothetical protein
MEVQTPGIPFQITKPQKFTRLFFLVLGQVLIAEFINRIGEPFLPE